MLLSHLLTTRGKSYSKFGQIPPIGLEGDSVMDGQTDGRADGRNNNVALVHYFHLGKSCSKFG